MRPNVKCPSCVALGERSQVRQTVTRGAELPDLFYDEVNRTDFGGDSIALKEDGVHDRYDRPPKLSSLSA